MKMAKMTENTATPLRPRMAGICSTETTSIKIAGIIATMEMLKVESSVVSMRVMLDESISPPP